MWLSAPLNNLKKKDNSIYIYVFSPEWSTFDFLHYVINPTLPEWFNCSPVTGRYKNNSGVQHYEVCASQEGFLLTPGMHLALCKSKKKGLPWDPGESRQTEHLPAVWMWLRCWCAKCSRPKIPAHWWHTSFLLKHANCVRIIPVLAWPRFRTMMHFSVCRGFA